MRAHVHRRARGSDPWWMAPVFTTYWCTSRRQLHSMCQHRTLSDTMHEARGSRRKRRRRDRSASRCTVRDDRQRAITGWRGVRASRTRTGNRARRTSRTGGAGCPMRQWVDGSSRGSVVRACEWPPLPIEGTGASAHPILEHVVEAEANVLYCPATQAVHGPRAPHNGQVHRPTHQDACMGRRPSVQERASEQSACHVRSHANRSSLLPHDVCPVLGW